MATCGIYKITSPSGKIYIGQSINIEGRRSKYVKNELYKQGKITHSIKKYGFDAHTFEIVGSYPKEELDRWEVFFILLYDSFWGPNGLNLTPGGRNYGVAVWRHAKSLKPRLPVYVRHPNGEIQKFNSALECAKTLPFGVEAIRRSCRALRVLKTHAFSYTGDFSGYRIEKERSDGKVVYVKDTLNNSITRHRALRVCAEATGVTQGSVTLGIRTGRLFKNRYYFSNDPGFPVVFDPSNKVNKPVYMKDLEGKVTKHASFAACAQVLGIHPDTIGRCIKENRCLGKSKRQNSKGYYFSRIPFEDLEWHEWVYK